MPAALANSVGLNGSSISHCSHDANRSSIPYVRVARGAAASESSYDANMAKRRTTVVAGPEQPDWFLADWMKSLRVSQAKLADECGWNRSTMHGIYHGRTDYYREIVNLISRKLNIEPYELLMPPDQAMALRTQREASERIVEVTKPFRDGTNG